ncbi:MAG TPA: hypothetical protein VLL75_17995 [Vicinamibacteria bacterium]|nr:hypothetical protein [Vicinamibacteria bacterium]
MVRRHRRSVSAFLASSLVIVLAAATAAPAAPQVPAPPAPPAPLAIAHSPVGCFVAGTNPQIDAGISPGGDVLAGRVYFHSALGAAFYYVEMAPEAGRYVGVLPKPRPDAGPITYYVEGVGRDFAQAQTPEARPIVVEKPEDCKGRPIAAAGPADPVRVFAVAGGTALPEGFSGVSSVVAAGVAANGAGAAAATTAAAAAEGGVSGTTIAIVGGAIAVGVGAVVIATGDDNPPASPTR